MTGLENIPEEQIPGACTCAWESTVTEAVFSLTFPEHDCSIPEHRALYEQAYPVADHGD